MNLNYNIPLERTRIFQTKIEEDGKLKKKNYNLKNTKKNRHITDDKNELGVKPKTIVIENKLISYNKSCLGLELQK